VRSTQYILKGGKESNYRQSEKITPNKPTFAMENHFNLSRNHNCLKLFIEFTENKIGSNKAIGPFETDSSLEEQKIV
jgi:hypothetical protein